MSQNFCNEESENLYNTIIEINKDIIEDPNQKSLDNFNLLNKNSLIWLCNTIYGTIPFKEPEENYCKDLIDFLAYLIFYLNKNHCFSDGNKRTTLIITMKILEMACPELSNEFFSGALKEFLVEMLKENVELEEVKNWLRKQFDVRYDLSDIEDSILKKGIDYKRLGEYDKAIEIYKYILNKYGSSALLYGALAKTLACKKDYNGAIKMFEKANEITKKTLGVYDYNFLYHIECLKNREEDSLNFLGYMKSISGDKNYTLNY